MTYKPIPEHRRRQLAKLLPELTHNFEAWNSPEPRQIEPERAFWNRELPPGSPEELVWMIRHAHVAAGFIDPARKQGYDWPDQCDLTGPASHRERWPLDPTPDEPQAQPTPEGPLVDGTPVKEGDVLYYVGGYKPFIGAEIIAGKPKSKTRVRIEGFYCLDGRWIDIGTMRANGLSRTKPVVIEGRVVKPGDVLYFKPSTPNPNVVGQERTVHKIVDTVLWFTNGATCGSPENMTYVDPKKVRVPSAKLGGVVRPRTTPRTEAEMPVKPEAFSFDLETMRPGQIAFDPKPVSRKLFDPAVLSTSVTKEKHTMNQTPSAQATPINHAMLTVDTSNIVEVKTFVYGRDIATLDDDILLNYVQSLTGAIEHLEVLNFKTPLVKLVTKIAQLKDAKAKIVDLLGGAPVQADSDGGTKGSPNVEAQPRKRRTKAEMEADNAKAVGTTPPAPQAPSKPVPPAPPAPAQPEPSVADVDLDD